MINNEYIRISIINFLINNNFFILLSTHLIKDNQIQTDINVHYD